MNTPREFQRDDHVTIIGPPADHWQGCSGVVLGILVGGTLYVRVRNSRIYVKPAHVELNLIAQLGSLA